MVFHIVFFFQLLYWLWATVFWKHHTTLYRNTLNELPTNKMCMPNHFTTYLTKNINAYTKYRKYFPD